jgi:hypothetical protein
MYKCMSVSAFVGFCALAACAEPATAPASTEPASRNWLSPVMRELSLAPAVTELFDDSAAKRKLGEVNWARGEIIALGEARAKAPTGQQAQMAARAARLIALRNALLMLVGGIEPGPGGAVKAIKDGSIELDAVVKDFEELSSEYDPRTGVATVRLRVPLYGAKGVMRLSGLALAQSRGRAFEWPPSEKPSDAVVVIDASHTKFRPCLLPRITSADGRTVLDAASVGATALMQRPLAVYCTPAPPAQMAAATAASASAPADGAVVLRAQSASGGTLMLDDDSLRRLGATGPAPLAAGRLVIIVSK